MTSYPNNIDEFRTVQNLPGIVYDKDQTKTIFAEDINNHSAAIAAIETELGTNPKNTATNVSERLDLMSAAIVTALSDASAALAAAEARKIPVNGVFISLSSTNPGTSLGYGTWSLTAEGCAVVGYESGDADFGTVGATTGSKTHTLTTNELPSHDHPGDTGRIFTGDQLLIISGGTNAVPKIRASTNTINATSTGSTGGGGAHNNIQKSMTFYIWKRTV